MIKLVILFAVASTFGLLKASSTGLPETETQPVQNPDPSAVLIVIDRAFNARAQEIGIPAAFVEFAAEDAVMYRNGMEPIIGREAIGELLSREAGASLVWKPLSADIATSEDLGYTRGSFTFHTAPGPDGAPAEGPYEGFYVSIWKKQADGSWKWVFDSGVISRLAPDNSDSAPTN